MALLGHKPYLLEKVQDFIQYQNLNYHSYSNWKQMNVSFQLNSSSANVTITTSLLCSCFAPLESHTLYLELKFFILQIFLLLDNLI